MIPVEWKALPLAMGGFHLIGRRTDIDRERHRYFGHTTLSHIESQLLPLLIFHSAIRLQAELLG